MSSSPRISFLRHKIIELRQALFFNLSYSVLKLPTSVINVLHVDERGNIWFLVHRPVQHVNEFEQDFASRLDFYRKGLPFYLHSTGKTSIVLDPEEIGHLSQLIPGLDHQLKGDFVLVRFRIEQVYYYETSGNNPVYRRELVGPGQSSTFVKTLHNIFKDIIPVFQSH